MEHWLSRKFGAWIWVMILFESGLHAKTHQWLIGWTLNFKFTWECRATLLHIFHWVLPLLLNCKSSDEIRMILTRNNLFHLHLFLLLFFWQITLTLCYLLIFFLSSALKYIVAGIGCFIGCQFLFMVRISWTLHTIQTWRWSNLRYWTFPLRHSFGKNSNHSSHAWPCVSWQVTWDLFGPMTEQWLSWKSGFSSIGEITMVQARHKSHWRLWYKTVKLHGFLRNLQELHLNLV